MKKQTREELITRIDEIGTRLCAISVFSPEWETLVKRRNELNIQLNQLDEPVQAQPRILTITTNRNVIKH